MPDLRLDGATKYYMLEKKKITAVEDINLTIEQGEFVFLTGSSGAGKTTVLRMLGGDLRPDVGSAYLGPVNMSRYFGPLQFRIRRSFGYVWQEPQLLRKRTIYENLFMALAARSIGRRVKWDKAVAKALALVGMQGVEHCFPADLSIGEVRLVELARALVNSPQILILDELTANLDDDNIWDIMYLLNELNNRGITIVMATHASQYVNIMRRRVVLLRDGRLVSDVHNGRYGETAPPDGFLNAWAEKQKNKRKRWERK